MKRFIDLRETDAGLRFAWWCTCKVRFETHSGSMAWDTWAEFAGDFDVNEARDGVQADGGGLPRYEGLCPDWAHIEPSEEDEDEDEQP